jgi:hypothetical protein
MLRKQRVQAQGALSYQPPRFVPWVYTLMRLGAPAYLRLVEGIDRVQMKGAERLIDAYRQFYSGSARLLLAFRHASVHDAPVMTCLLSRVLPRAARRAHLELGGLPHAHYLYGRGVTLWAGGGSAFLIPRIAALSIMNRRSDSQGVAAIRQFLIDGPFPMALAPEGQVTYHNHRLGPMEPGAARLGLWGLRELERRHRSEEILILPLAVQYGYPRRPGRILRQVMQRAAGRAGLQLPPGESAYEGLMSLTEQLVGRMEEFYRRFYRHAFACGAQGSGTTEGGSLQARIERVCQAALRVPEGFMDLRSEGDLLARVFAVRQKGWDYLFRADLPARELRSPLQRVLADRLADEAYLHLRHNELVDVLEYLRPDYIGPEASTNRLIEYALNLADVVNRLCGGDISHRYSPPHKAAEVRVGEPLALRSLRGELPGDKRAKADRVLDLLRTSFEELSREEAASTAAG